MNTRLLASTELLDVALALESGRAATIEAALEEFGLGDRDSTQVADQLRNELGVERIRDRWGRGTDGADSKGERRP
jgi:hypothetical protein